MCSYYSMIFKLISLHLYPDPSKNSFQKHVRVIVGVKKKVYEVYCAVSYKQQQ